VPIERSLLSSREVLECSRIARARAFDEELYFAFCCPAQRALELANPLKSIPARVEERKTKVVVIVRQAHADLLILDIMMPGLSALEVYDRVRADAGIRDMPVRSLCPA
jgi:CheY-like chemotaxis protein